MLDDCRRLSNSDRSGFSHIGFHLYLGDFNQITIRQSKYFA